MLSIISEFILITSPSQLSTVCKSHFARIKSIVILSFHFIVFIFICLKCHFCAPLFKLLDFNSQLFRGQPLPSVLLRVCFVGDRLIFLFFFFVFCTMYFDNDTQLINIHYHVRVVKFGLGSLDTYTIYVYL